MHVRRAATAVLRAVHLQISAPPLPLPPPPPPPLPAEARPPAASPGVPAVLSYGLSSEYLKTTKEAEAKAKVPDADRSLYRWGRGRRVPKSCGLWLALRVGRGAGGAAGGQPIASSAPLPHAAPRRPARSRYYVQSLLKLDEEALHSAWAKVGASWVRL